MSLIMHRPMAAWISFRRDIMIGLLSSTIQQTSVSRPPAISDLFGQLPSAILPQAAGPDASTLVPRPGDRRGLDKIRSDNCPGLHFPSDRVDTQCFPVGAFGVMAMA